MNNTITPNPPQQNGSDPGNAPAAPAPSALQAPQPRPVRFSVLRNHFDTAPVVCEQDWNGLAQLLSSYQFRENTKAGKNGPLFSPAELVGGKDSSCLRAVHFGVLDVDGDNHEGMPVDQFLALAALLERYDWFGYTTWSQPQASTRSALCARILVPFSRPVQPQEWATVRARFVAEFGGRSDPKTDDPVRAFYTPSLPIGCEWAAQTWKASDWQGGARAWDVDAALRAGPVLAASVPVQQAAFARAERGQLVKFAKKLAGSARPEAASVGACIVAALNGAPMAEPGMRHGAMLSITMQLAREFHCYTLESIADPFADSFAAMDRQGVKEPSRGHFLKQMGTAIEKRAAERATQARSGLLYTDKGVLKPIVANVLQLMSGGEWDGVLAFNEFANEISKLREPPCREIDRAQKPSVCFDDADGIRAAAWFQAQYRLDASPELVMTAAVAAAQRKTFHPVRDWLEALSWDGASRHHMLPACFGAEDTAYTRAVLSRFLISAVARVFKPGCKVDTVLCLVGGQGKKKSTALSVLASNGDWFSDSPIDLDSKDGMQALNGKWIIEIPELDSFKGKSATRIKSFASSATDNYRPSYGRTSKPFPRHCVFAATTNEPEFLTDQTGNRRFWPVKCGAIDLELIKVAREQLWAEAVALYRAGAPWWLQESDLEASASEVQAEHTEQDPWLVHLARWVATRSEPFTVADALSGALELPLSQQNQRTSTRAGMMLSKLGWGPRQLRGEGGKRTRLYEITNNTKWTAAQAELGITVGKVRAPALVDVSQYAPALASGGVPPAWAKATA